MTATYCNDHDRGDNASYDLENLFKPHDEYVCDNIESGFGRVSTLAKNNPTILEERQLCMHADHEEKILLNSHIVEFDYVLHIIITREENMVVEIFMLLNFLSLC